MVTDLAEVFRLGTAHARENLEFRRYLSAHHDSGKMFPILANQVREQIDCTACANCCKHSTVAISAEDIERIAAYLEISVEAVKRLYTVRDEGRQNTPILASNENGCVFLDGNLCMIYESRPKTCRDFPHIAAEAHTLGGRPSSHARWAALCPIIYNALEMHKHLAGFHPHPGDESA